MPVSELLHPGQGLHPALTVVPGDVSAGGEDEGPGGVVRDETGSSARVLELVVRAGGPLLQTEHFRRVLVVIIPANQHQSARSPRGQPAGVVSPVAGSAAQGAPLAGLQVHADTVVPGVEVVPPAHHHVGLAVVLGITITLASSHPALIFTVRNPTSWGS